MADSLSEAVKTPFRANGRMGMPWWVQAITVVGVPGVLVLYMVYTTTQELPATRRAAELAITEILHNREILNAHMTKAESNYRLLQRICANTAKSYEERNRCFD